MGELGQLPTGVGPPRFGNGERVCLGLDSRLDNDGKRTVQVRDCRPIARVPRPRVIGSDQNSGTPGSTAFVKASVHHAILHTT